MPTGETFLIIIGVVIAGYGVGILYIIVKSVFFDKPKPEPDHPQEPPRAKLAGLDFSSQAIKKNNGVIVGFFDAKLSPTELEYLDFYESHSWQEIFKFVKGHSSKFSPIVRIFMRSEEHTSELQSLRHLVC